MLDFIDLHYNNFHWYVFNIADITITVGCILTIILELFFKEKENQNEINVNLANLNEQIKNVNTHSAGIDEKLSNFLSTQLNTQSSILQLINKINDQGFLDSSTRKIFEDLNQSIKKLNTKNKK